MLLLSRFFRDHSVNINKTHADDFISISFSFESRFPVDPPCVYLFNKSDPNFAEKIRHIRDPKMRMGVVWAHCKTKMTCEPDEPKEEGADPEVEELKKGHGGCGHAQPQIRKEGLKMFVQYKKTKDDNSVCFKLTFFAFKVYFSRRRSSHCSLARG